MTTASAAHTADFAVHSGGSVYILTPLTESGRDWIEENVAYEDYQRFGEGIAVEYRYVGDILHGILEDGLTIEGKGA